MANQDTGNAGQLSAKEIATIRQEAVALRNTVGGISQDLKESIGLLGDLVGENTAGYDEAFSASKALNTAMQAVDARTIASKKEQLVFASKVRKAEEESTRIQAKANRLRAEMGIMSIEEQKAATRVARKYEEAADQLKEQAKSARQITEQFEILNKKVKVFDDLAGFFSEIPGLSKVFGEFQRAADAAGEAASKGGNGFVAGAKELTGALVKGVAAYGISTMVKGIANADERIVSLGRNLSKSRQESIALVKNFNEVARSVQGLTGTELQKSAEGYSEALGSTGIISVNTATTMATQVKYMQLSTEEANKLNTLTEATGGDITQQTQDIIGQTQISNARNKTGIKYQAIMKDVSNASSATKLLILGQGKNLAAAAIEAKKLGTTMEGIANIGKSMLDFESSIGNELEAELLTGGEINNERARALALMGDTEGLAKEVAASGVLAKFEGSKNVLQQEALAKAYGMSKDEMANMVVESKALASLGAKDKSELSEKVKKELQRIDTLKDSTEKEKARGELIKKLGSDEMVRQRDNLTIAESQALANERIVEAMDMLIPIIKPISELFKFIADHAKAFAVALAMLTAGSMLSKISNLADSLKSVKGGAAGATSVAESLAGGQGAGMGKQLATLAKNPKAYMRALKMGGGLTKLAGGAGSILGGVALDALSENRMNKADELQKAGKLAEAKTARNVGKGADVGSLALTGAGIGGSIGALFGGIGAVPGAAIGGAVGAGYGAYKNFFADAEEASDFIIRPGQKPLKFRKDDIVMGGTSLTGNATAGTGGGNVEALLRELIAAVKEGGNIHIGANKLNEAIGINLHPMR